MRDGYLHTYLLAALGALVRIVTPQADAIPIAVV